MYSRDGALKSVGELGLLLYDSKNHWQTVDFGNRDHAKVFDRFKLGDYTFRRGVVNPNTWEPAVMVALLTNAPLARYPSESTGLKWLTGTNLGFVATELVNYTCTRQMYLNTQTNTAWDVIRGEANRLYASDPAKPVYTNASDFAYRLAKVLEDLNTSLPASDQMDRSQREGLVRATAGLVSPRQNLFGIYLVVEHGNPADNFDGNANLYLAQSRVFFTLWRDPYLTPHPELNVPFHRSFVQMVKRLDW
jgi:hypothetical protein